MDSLVNSSSSNNPFAIYSTTVVLHIPEHTAENVQWIPKVFVVVDSSYGSHLTIIKLNNRKTLRVPIQFLKVMN